MSISMRRVGTVGSLGLLVAVAITAGAVGCGGSSGAATGHERGPCYGNGTCDPGLTCLSNLCVKGNASDGGAGAGAAGASGGAGSGGSAGAAGTVGDAGSGGAGEGGASGGPGVAGSAGATDGGAGGNAGAAGGAGSDAGAGSGGDASTDAGTDGATDGTSVALTCAKYCDAVQLKCVANTSQYTTTAECLAACPAFPVGAAGLRVGNTLGCRYGQTAETDPKRSICGAAGPSGGGVCGTDPCVPYCALMAAHCPNAYASPADCAQACGAFASGVGEYSSNATSNGGNTAYCYLAFATLAAVDPTLQCPHAVPNNITCKN